MFVVCTPEQSEALLEDLADIEKEMFTELGLHFKILVCFSYMLDLHPTLNCCNAAPLSIRLHPFIDGEFCFEKLSLQDSGQHLASRSE